MPLHVDKRRRAAGTRTEANAACAFRIESALVSLSGFLGYRRTVRVQAGLVLLMAVFMCQSSALSQAQGTSQERTAAVQDLVGKLQGVGASNDVCVNRISGEYVRFLGAPPDAHFPGAAGAGKGVPEKAEAFFKENQRIFMDESPRVDFRTTRTQQFRTSVYKCSQ